MRSCFESELSVEAPAPLIMQWFSGQKRFKRAKVLSFGGKESGALLQVCVGSAPVLDGTSGAELRAGPLHSPKRVAHLGQGTVFIPDHKKGL